MINNNEALKALDKLFHYHGYTSRNVSDKKQKDVWGALKTIRQFIQSHDGAEVEQKSVDDMVDFGEDCLAFSKEACVGLKRVHPCRLSTYLTIQYMSENGYIKTPPEPAQGGDEFYTLVDRLIDKHLQPDNDLIEIDRGNLQYFCEQLRQALMQAQPVDVEALIEDCFKNADNLSVRGIIDHLTTNCKIVRK